MAGETRLLLLRTRATSVSHSGPVKLLLIYSNFREPIYFKELISSFKFIYKEFCFM